jgi:hypothetical protein
VPHVRANGIDVHYTVEGAGPPLIMLHGATSSAVEDWAAQRPLFRKAFRIYLVDARGHGGTKWDSRDGFSRDMLVDDLLAFADALELATEPDLARFALEGVSDVQTTNHSVNFLYRGPVNAITRLLAEQDLLDFLVEEPDLEEIFLHYYQKEE